MGDLVQGRSGLVLLSEVAGMVFGFGSPRFFSFTRRFRDRPSAASSFNFRVNGSQLTASIRNLHLPIDASLSGVDIRRPSGNFAL
jgi:hypothetical protein